MGNRLGAQNHPAHFRAQIDLAGQASRRPQKLLCSTSQSVEAGAHSPPGSTASSPGLLFRSEPSPCTAPRGAPVHFRLTAGASPGSLPIAGATPESSPFFSDISVGIFWPCHYRCRSDFCSVRFPRDSSFSFHFFSLRYLAAALHAARNDATPFLVHAPARTPLHITTACTSARPSLPSKPPHSRVAWLCFLHVCIFVVARCSSSPTYGSCFYAPREKTRILLAFVPLP